MQWKTIEYEPSVSVTYAVTSFVVGSAAAAEYGVVPPSSHAPTETGVPVVGLVFVNEIDVTAELV